MKICFISLSFIVAVFSFSQIRITNPVYEFGDIFEESGLVYAEFELENPYSRDTIFISSILTTCGCMIVETKDSIIYPTTKMKLKIAYDPIGRVGSFYKTIQINTVTTNRGSNKLYLKLGGNVIPKNKIADKNAQLIDYDVAPLYFYPITEYDTSFLDFNYIEDFVNTLTYEIDFYQFSKVRFEVSLSDMSKIKEFNYLLRFVKYKLLRELKNRGYSESSIFFSETRYNIEHELPKWASAEIKVRSVAFNNDNLNESTIKMTNRLNSKEPVLLINENRELSFSANYLVDKVDFQYLSNRLLKDTLLSLSINCKVPESFSLKKQKKLISSFKKMLYKELEALVGIEKGELVIQVDSVYIHASNKHKFVMWEKENPNEKNRISYQSKEETIISPLLPTYKHQFLNLEGEIDSESKEFKQFWNTLMAYSKTSNNIKLMIESSTSHYPKGDNSDAIYSARQRANLVKQQILDKYYAETGKLVDIEIVNVVLGPKWNDRKKHLNFSRLEYLQYEYINLIPIFTIDRKLNLEPVAPLPYMVNYEYFFKAVDTTSFVFKKFTKFLIYEIQKNGYVRITTESSNSKIPFEKNKANEYIAYEHLNESKKLLNDYLKKHLIDPNRLIIDKENIIVQGIPYTKDTPIIRYKKFHYVRFIPALYLTQ